MLFYTDIIIVILLACEIIQFTYKMLCLNYEFLGKKIQLMRIKGQSDINEEMLFHGTGAKNVHSISTFNFNCRLPDMKRKGHILGKGRL